MSTERLSELASKIEDVSNEVGDLIYDALRTQTRGDDEATAAKELERELSKVRRSLTKAAQILEELSRR